MFSKRVINTARFLKMPSSTQNLYFHLGLNADDDGVVEAFSVIRLCGATEDDLRILVAKGFVKVLNEELVSFIVDWHENNSIRQDRKIDSIYHDLLEMIPEAIPDKKTKGIIDRQPSDNQMPTNCQPNANKMPSDGWPKISQDKKSKDKKSEDKSIKTGDEELDAAIEDFIEFRKKAKSPMTVKAVSLLITKLNKLTSDQKEKIDILNQSIMNGWKGVYPINRGKESGRKSAVDEWQ